MDVEEEEKEEEKEEKEEEEEDDDVEEEDRSQDREAHFVRACAVEMYTDITEVLCGNLQEKCRTPSPRHPFCASLRSRHADGHVRRGFLII